MIFELRQRRNIRMTVFLTINENKEIIRLCKQKKISRSNLIRNLVEKGLGGKLK